MKKVIIIGVLVALITGCKSKQTTYEYYDLKNNYGTSSRCELTENGAMCLINGDMVLVNQFSEKEEKK